MPQLVIKTNVSKCKIPKDFWQKSTKLVADMLEKPAAATMVVVETDVSMTFGGTHEPTALIVLHSIGNISRDENKKWSSLIFPHIQASLGISPDRVFLIFVDLNRNNLAWKGITFDDILPPE